MSSDTKLFCGILLLVIPTIQYGGYFLLTILTGKFKVPLTEFQKSMARAGHAHAGVIIILSLVAEILADYANLSPALISVVRIGFPASALLISGGFFAASAGKYLVKPNKFIWILYLGVMTLACVVIILGIGLIRGS